MKKYIFMISILSFFGCKTSESLNNKLEVTTITTKPERVEVKDENGHVRSRNTYVDEIERLKPEIIILDTKNRQFKYKIQGNITSRGLSIRRVKTIQSEQRIEGSTLVIKQTVMVKSISGKEGAQVAGYNYQQENVAKIPESINTIKIELHEQSQLKGSEEIKSKLLTAVEYKI